MSTAGILEALVLEHCFPTSFNREVVALESGAVVVSGRPVLEVLALSGRDEEVGTSIETAEELVVWSHEVAGIFAVDSLLSGEATAVLIGVL